MMEGERFPFPLVCYNWIVFTQKKTKRETKWGFKYILVTNLFSLSYSSSNNV